MRMLVLHHEGAPVLVSSTPGPIKTRILEWPGDDADLWQVWSTPGDDSYMPASDITEQFALTWAMEFAFGDGIEPADFLAPFPAFVREVARDKLIAKWRAEMTSRPPVYLPNPLRKIA